MTFDVTAYTQWLVAQGLSGPSARLYARHAARIARSVHRTDPGAWLERQVTATTPQGTRQTYQSAARHYARWLTAQGVEVAEPTASTGRRVQGHQREALETDELEEMLRATATLPGHVRAIVQLLPLTGLRIGEICALPKSAVQVRQGDHGLYFIGKRSKWRWVPLTDGARAALRQYLTEERPQGDFLFPSPQDPSRSIHPETVRRHLRELREGLGPWAASVSPHVLRHTFATMLHGKGVSLVELQHLLGHERIETTSIYTHPTNKTLAAAIRKLDKEDPR